MPELPDLTVFSDNLTKRLKGKKVQSVEYHKEKRLNVGHEELRNSLLNTSIEMVNRSGKEIEFKFSNDMTMFVHLMLSGGFSITQTPESVKFRVLTISFYDGVSMVVSDPKGLVTVNLNPQKNSAPDALEVDVTYLKKKVL